MFSIYILENYTKSLFIGVTRDVDLKLEEHRNELKQKGKDFEQLKLVYIYSSANPFDVLEQERKLRNLSKAKLVKHVMLNTKEPH